jgi:hypothetical protein
VLLLVLLDNSYYSNPTSTPFFARTNYDCLMHSATDEQIGRAILECKSELDAPTHISMVHDRSEGTHRFF